MVGLPSALVVAPDTGALSNYLRLYEAVCVARTWPAPLATLFNGEPVADETGGGHVVTVNGDYLRSTSGGPKRQSPSRSQRFRRRESYPARGILGITI